MLKHSWWVKAFLVEPQGTTLNSVVVTEEISFTQRKSVARGLISLQVGSVKPCNLISHTFMTISLLEITKYYFTASSHSLSLFPIFLLVKNKTKKAHKKKKNQPQPEQKKSHSALDYYWFAHGFRF